MHTSNRCRRFTVTTALLVVSNCSSAQVSWSYRIEPHNLTVECTEPGVTTDSQPASDVANSFGPSIVEEIERVEAKIRQMGDDGYEVVGDSLEVDVHYTMVHRRTFQFSAVVPDPEKMLLLVKSSSSSVRSSVLYENPKLDGHISNATRQEMSESLSAWSDRTDARLHQLFTRLNKKEFPLTDSEHRSLAVVRKVRGEISRTETFSVCGSQYSISIRAQWIRDDFR